MCTVTFIPVSSGFYLTTSRDERAGRLATPPSVYNVEGMKLVFPKDELAGGTWVASDISGRSACLLNGAFERHIRKQNYKRSRGLVLLDSFKYRSTSQFESLYDFDGIEPFTLIALDYSTGNLSRFDELRWDGQQTHLKSLDQNKEQIWSSAALYSAESRKRRKDLFDEWIERYRLENNRNIFNFHNIKHGLASVEDIIMKGEEDLRTVSISQISHVAKENAFKYSDLLNGENYEMVW